MTANNNCTHSRGQSSSSPTSGYNDDWDAITPCPSPEPEEHPASPYNPEVPNDNNQTYQYQGGASADGRPYSRETRTGRASSGCRVSAEQRRRASLVLGTGRTEKDAERLWARMLELQQKYGCYNSARMQAALEDGDSTVRKLKSSVPVSQHVRRLTAPA